jgi:hypothetical protein
MEGGPQQVAKRQTTVLVAGFDKHSFEALGPVLERRNFEVARMASPDVSVELAVAKPFDIIIINAEGIGGTLAPLVDDIRDEKSASRKTSLLVMAEADEADAIRGLIGRGVNRVMLLDDSPELIGQQVAALLNVAPRAAVRFSVRLKTSVSHRNVNVPGEVVNLSVSGMLVETDTPFQPDDEVVISLDLGDPWGSISTKAVVVRQAYRTRGGIDGIGIRFADLTDEVRAKIAAFLDKVFSDQLNG